MRTVDSSAITVLNGQVVPCVMFIQMDLTSTLYLNTSAVNIVWNSQTWLGTGSVGSVDEIEDKAAEQKSLKFTLSGVPVELLAIALAEPIRGKPCRVYLAILDPSTHAVLDVPAVWAGTLDQMPITQGSQTCTISVTAEHSGATYSRPKPLRYTDADQQRLYPGDTALRFVVSQSQHQDIWPAASYFRR